MCGVPHSLLNDLKRNCQLILYKTYGAVKGSELRIMLDMLYCLTRSRNLFHMPICGAIG